MIENFQSLLKSKPRILILGFGREGRSTFHLLRKYFPDYLLSISDQNPNVSEFAELKNDLSIKLFLGNDYLNAAAEHDLIIKSPGISLNGIKIGQKNVITSQTDIFLSFFAKQTIGITGTKGKSTTVSLIYHFLKNTGKRSVLLGNIGVPPFDKIDEITEETIIVFEMSAHQLELIHHSPHIAVLLNLFPEHLDHFSSLEKYYSSKLNIGKFQKENDVLIVEKTIAGLLPKIKSELLVFGKEKGLSAWSSENKVYFSNTDFQIDLSKQNIPLVGEHNLNNLMAAMLAVEKIGIGYAESINCLPSFKTLPHRLEYVGKFGKIDFYNDSISTVPESTIAALESLKYVDTLILGGFDRGIDYSLLTNYISNSTISNLIFLGKAGDEMMKLLDPDISMKKGIYKVSDMKDAFQIIKKYSRKETICLLSPAAASYDQFHNFEHRGDVFSDLAKKFI